MPYSRNFIPGDRLVDCDICGLAYRRSQMRRGIMGKQKGLIVCPFDFDAVHPNEARVKNRREGALEEIN